MESISTTIKSLAMPRSDEQAADWSVATWEGAEREQLRRWAELSLEEIVRAQEEMQNLAKRLARRKSAGVSKGA